MAAGDALGQRHHRLDQPQAAVAQPPLRWASGGAHPPKSNVTKPLSNAPAIGIHTSGLTSTATGPKIWKRAITSGIVTSQMVALIASKSRSQWPI